MTPILEQQRAHYAGYIGRSAKDERAERMLWLYNHGFTPAEIADEVGCTQRTVYVRLNDLGVDFERGRPDDLWGMPEDERRVQITQRAARAAREALKQFRTLPPLSTVSTAADQNELTGDEYSVAAGFEVVIKEITSTEAGASHG